MSAAPTTHGPAIAAALLNRTVTSAHSIPANFTRLYRDGVVISAGASVSVAADAEMLIFKLGQI